MTHADAADAPRPGGGAPGDSGSGGGSSPVRGGGADRAPGVGARLVRFLREVWAELSKVVRPTRRELLTYTAVVLVFVAVVMLYVSALDFVFGRAVLWVFGGG
ncbi:preprotein translocase subunit SecE [uncultured Pseudokineococcus sp.]|uniref:preprotein translocase subunit SecE n=1 Tax=uncultured Pseudokineococcus sp. TaxID=1642928 RepID=UPI00260FE1AB|nr:preprotein translocase subunit SecE [uncultured Pseudokineococcus sp.]